MKKIYLFFLALFLFFSQAAYSDFYLRPHGGFIFNQDLDSFSVIGVKTGYTFTDFFAISADYSYVDRANDPNLVGASATLFWPLIPIITPYVNLGTIVYPWESNVIGGTGIMINPPMIEFISFGVGVDYYYYFEAEDFAELSFLIGLRI